jgi:DNA-binding CsgD family transcriptional regulator
VTELVAQGRTNREIATELFVTVKAVRFHLGNIYRKLGVQDRAQIAAAVNNR